MRCVAPVVNNNVLYSVNEYGLLIFDALTGVKTKTIGNDLISKSLKNSRINSSPSFYPPRFYDNEIIFHAQKDGNLYVNSFNTMSGIKEELFKTKLFYPYPSLLVSNGLLITINDSYLLAYNLKTRKEDWYLNSGIYISQYSTITSPDKVFAIDYSDVYAADLFSGERKWEVRYNSSIVSSPLYFDDKLFISTSNSLKVLSSENGKELWDYSLINPNHHQFHPSPLVITTTGESIHSGGSGELQ